MAVPILVHAPQVPVLAARVVLAEGLSMAYSVSRASLVYLGDMRTDGGSGL